MGSVSLRKRWTLPVGAAGVWSRHLVHFLISNVDELATVIHHASDLAHLLQPSNASEHFLYCASIHTCMHGCASLRVRVQPATRCGDPIHAPLIAAQSEQLDPPAQPPSFAVTHGGRHTCRESVRQNQVFQRRDGRAVAASWCQSHCHAGHLDVGHKLFQLASRFLWAVPFPSFCNLKVALVKQYSVSSVMLRVHPRMGGDKATLITFQLSNTSCSWAFTFSASARARSSWWKVNQRGFR